VKLEIGVGLTKRYAPDTGHGEAN